MRNYLMSNYEELFFDYKTCHNAASIDVTNDGMFNRLSADYALNDQLHAILGFLSPWCWIVVFPVLAAVLGAPWTDSALKKWAGIERCQPFSNTRGLFCLTDSAGGAAGQTKKNRPQLFDYLENFSTCWRMSSASLK